MFEVKTNVTTKDIQKSLVAAAKVIPLMVEAEEFGEVDSFASPQLALLAYNCYHRLASLEKAFFVRLDPQHTPADAIFLRYHSADRASTGALGGHFHLEPSFAEETGPVVDGYLPLSIPSHTPLSDLYYGLVQNSYFTLGARDFSLSQIGGQFSHYMNWSTALRRFN